MSELGIKKILDDRILVEEDAAPGKTSSGLTIPSEAQEKSTTGKVLLVGPGTPEKPMEINTGDHIMYGKFSGTEIDIKGKKCKIIRHADVILILDVEKSVNEEI